MERIFSIFFCLKIAIKAHIKLNTKKLYQADGCSERTIEDHFCPLQRYEDQRHGGLSTSRGGRRSKFKLTLAQSVEEQQSSCSERWNALQTQLNI